MSTSIALSASPVGFSAEAGDLPGVVDLHEAKRARALWVAWQRGDRNVSALLAVLAQKVLVVAPVQVVAREDEVVLDAVLHRVPRTATCTAAPRRRSLQTHWARVTQAVAGGGYRLLRDARETRESAALPTRQLVVVGGLLTACALVSDWQLGSARTAWQTQEHEAANRPCLAP